MSKQKFNVTWKSSSDNKRKECTFSNYGQALDWYKEKLSEKKKPKMFEVKTVEIELKITIESA